MTTCMFCTGDGCLFCNPPKHPWFNAKSASAGQVANFNRGLHPMGARLLSNVSGAERCGNCTHHKKREMGGTYHKCDLYETHGPATDIRVSWPACEKYESDGGVPF